MTPVVVHEPAAGLRVSPAGHDHRRFLFFILIISVVLLWLPQLRSSLWLDEASVYWEIRDGLFKAIERAHRYSPSGTLYVAIISIVSKFAGTSEWALRLPSVVSAMLAALILIRIGRHFRDDETGLLAAIIFSTEASVSFAAVDVRPYALALLTVNGAFYCLARWVSVGKSSHAITYALLATASVYLHRFFAVMFLIHAFYLWTARRHGSGWNSRAVFRIALLIGALLLPLAAETLSFLGRSQDFSWSGIPPVSALALLIVPPLVVFSLLIGGVVALAIVPDVAVESGSMRAVDARFLAAWALTPPVLLYLLSVFSPAKAFVGRYAMSAIPGLSILAASVMRSLEPPRARRIVAQVVLFVSILSIFSTVHGGEDWRAASAQARKYIDGDSTPVLVRSGAIESRDVSWLVDPETRDYMLGPLIYYPVGGDVIPLPWDLEAKPRLDYMEAIVTKQLVTADRFLLIARAFGDDGKMASWLRGRVGPLGFCSRAIGSFGAVEAIVFDRNHREWCS